MKFKFYTFMFWAFLFSSPFINFSLFPSSKLPITYLLLFVFILVKGKLFLNSKILSYDLFFIYFLMLMLFSVFLNSFYFFEILSITQILNLLLTYLIFKSVQILRLINSLDTSKVIDKFFKFNSWLCFISILFYLVGLFEENFIRAVFNFMNNSGNFSKGGMVTAFNEDVSARLNSLAPEPSFWGFFSAFNLAIGLSQERKRHFYLFITLVTLLLTISRTGYLMLVLYIFYRFWKYNLFFKILICIILSICSTYLLSLINIDFLLSIDESFRQRFGSLIIGFELFINNPFFGIGLGKFSSLAQNLGLDFRDVFSLFLNFLLAGGILSFLFFLIFCFIIYKKLQPQYKPVWIIILIGWLTVSSYNLPFVWVFLGIVLDLYEEKENSYFRS